jgi:hypothetical protein
LGWAVGPFRRMNPRPTDDQTMPRQSPKTMRRMIADEKNAPQAVVLMTARTAAVQRTVRMTAVQGIARMTAVPKRATASAALKVAQPPTTGGLLQTHVLASAVLAASSAGLTAKDQAACPARSVVRRLGLAALVVLAASTGELPRWSESSMKFCENCTPCAAREVRVIPAIVVVPLKGAAMNIAVPTAVASQAVHRREPSAAEAADFMAGHFLRRPGAVMKADGLAPVVLVPIVTATAMIVDRLRAATESDPIAPATGRRTCGPRKMTICPSNGNVVRRTDGPSITLR